VPVRALHVTDAQARAMEKPVDIAFVCMNEETTGSVVGWGNTLRCIASSITLNLPEPGLGAKL